MVIIGFLGTVLDNVTRSARRWKKWRPTISLFQHEHLRIKRMELLTMTPYNGLAERVALDIKQIAPNTEVNIHTLSIKDPWDFQEVFGVLHEFSTNYLFDLENENYFMHITTGTHVAQICMFLLTETKYFPAKLIQTSPPQQDEERSGHYTIIDLDLSKYDGIASRFKKEQLAATDFLKSGIVTKNLIFNRLIEQIEHVAIKSVAPILLSGPTGAGKTQLARKIYELKKMRHQMTGGFIEINCATLRGDMASSTLFGHKKGAFTGAHQDRAGLLAQAHQGILFLDEISELGLDEQAVLLRAIEEKKFRPVGADKEVTSAFQIIAGTNKNLSEEVAEGRFRRDLWARLNMWTFVLPGLKDRREDIEPNIDYELGKYMQEYGNNITFNQEAKVHYLQFCLSEQASWLANFRDLSYSIHRMATLSQGGRITLNEAKEEIDRLKQLWQLEARDNSMSILQRLFSDAEIAAIDLFERSQLAEVIKVCLSASSMSEAGRLLYSNSREKKKSQNDADRLSKYLQRFNLTWALIQQKV